MKTELRVCDFCWNDDSRIVLAKASYMSGDGSNVDVCAKHAKSVAEAGFKTEKIEEPELPYW